MLESLRTYSQSKVIQILLALFFVPFIFVGMDSYFDSSSRTLAVAKVGNLEIPYHEFQETLKSQQEKMRASLGRNFDSAMFDTPEVKKALLGQMVDKKLIESDARAVGLGIPDGLLIDVIAREPAFHEDGKFSRLRYEKLLQNQNMSPAMFEQRIRQDMAVQFAQEGIALTAAIPDPVLDRLITLYERKMEVSTATLKIEDYLPRVKIDPSEIKAYFDKNQEEYKLPEQSRVEYVVLSAENLQASERIDEAEITQYYKDHLKQFSLPEERRASHILLMLPQGAKETDRDAALAQARKLLAEARKQPAAFAELAQEHSQDTGSAKQGGDLGLFSRGAMVKPFEDTVFAMSPGEISEPVVSEFGVHIIKLTEIKPEKQRELSEVRAEIIQTLRQQKAVKKFSESAESFGNMVYEQSDSLEPAAKAFGLKIEQSGWLSRRASEVPLLNHPKLLEAAFSEDVQKNKRNSEAIEVAPNTLVAVRLIETKPASIRPFSEVEASIGQRLQRQQAVKLTLEAGKDILAQLQQGKPVSDLKWNEKKLVSRSQPGTIEPALLNEAVKLKQDKFPGYAGMANNQGGYTLLRLQAVQAAEPVTDVQRQAYRQRFGQALTQAYLAAYLDSLRDRTQISIKSELLEKSAER